MLVALIFMISAANDAKEYYLREPAFKQKFQNEIAFQNKNGARIESQNEKWTIREVEGNYIFDWTTSTENHYARFVPGWNFDGAVRSKVEKASGVYKFIYTVINSTKSKQSILELNIDVLDPVAKGSSTNDIVARPLSFSDWHKYSWAWFCAKTPYGLSPGASGTGYILESQNLPTLGDCYLSGAEDNLGFTSDDVEQIPLAVYKLYPGPFEGSKIGTTIVPGLATTSWAEIDQYVDEIFKLNWLTDDVVKKSLLQLIATAKNLKSKDVLEALNSQHTEKNISDEVWALLYYNIEWLIQHPEATPQQIPIPLEEKNATTSKPSQP